MVRPARTGLVGGDDMDGFVEAVYFVVGDGVHREGGLNFFIDGLAGVHAGVDQLVVAGVLGEGEWICRFILEDVAGAGLEVALDEGVGRCDVAVGDESVAGDEAGGAASTLAASAGSTYARSGFSLTLHMQALSLFAHTVPVYDCHIFRALIFLVFIYLHLSVLFISFCRL